ncbi:uncharacterized protein [Nothobranchius furzeri]|uniref:uncharacterized protein isoform X2 n=1 Tax=Nothobranchius furzeri TaxID=105023 RepID=UPI0039048ECA
MLVTAVQPLMHILLQILAESIFLDFVLLGAILEHAFLDSGQIVEAIFVQLCMAYPNPKRVEGVAFSRWTLIIRAYKHIRACILNNFTIMEETRGQQNNPHTVVLQKHPDTGERHSRTGHSGTKASHFR